MKKSHRYAQSVKNFKAKVFQTINDYIIKKITLKKVIVLINDIGVLIKLIDFFFTHFYK